MTMEQSLNPTMAGAIMQYGLVWAIEPQVGLGFWEAVRNQPMSEHISEFASSKLSTEALSESQYFAKYKLSPKESLSSRASYYDGNFVGDKHEAASEKPFVLNSDGIAQFLIDGPMTKQVSWSANGTSTVYLRRIMSLAARDPDVKGGLVKVDSPGGSAAGTADLADAFNEFAAKKPLYAFAEDWMASAAFWAACGCTRIYATPTTHIGSVGTILVIPDMSKMAKQMGVDVLVFTNDGADLKGAGTPGTEVTDKHKAYFRGMVNGIQSHFSQAVMDGRSLSKEQIRALAGRVFIADQAQSLGLIDGICSYQECAAMLTDHVETGEPAQSKLTRPPVPTPRGGPKSNTTKSMTPRPAMASKELFTMSENANSALAKVKTFLNSFTGIDAEDETELGAAPPVLAGPKLTAALPAASAGFAPASIAILAACATAGITSEAQVHTVAADAKDGRELKATLIKEVQFQAIRAFGAEDGPKACAGLEHLPSAVLVEKRDAFRTHANTKVGITEEAGANRASAGGELPALATGARTESPDALDEGAAARKAGAEYAARMNGTAKH